MRKRSNTLNFYPTMPKKKTKRKKAPKNDGSKTLTLELGYGDIYRLFQEMRNAWLNHILLNSEENTANLTKQQEDGLMEIAKRYYFATHEGKLQLVDQFRRHMPFLLDILI